MGVAVAGVRDHRDHHFIVGGYLRHPAHQIRERGQRPLSAGFSWRGVARWGLGLRCWREDFDRAIAMARGADLGSQAVVFAYAYGLAVQRGVLLAGDNVVRDIDEALKAAERASEDVTLVLLRFSLGIALLHREPIERQRGLDQLAELRDMCLSQRYALNLVPGIDIYLARETALRGDLDDAVKQLRALSDDAFNCQYVWTFESAVGALVETLLDRGGETDLAEAERAIESLAAVPPHLNPVSREITGLRLRALVARARGDEVTYRELVDRYRSRAISLGFEGHIATAEAMAVRAN
jgi:adenylate cyclase